MATIYNKNNMSTEEVKKMQQALVDAGYDVGKYGVDGIWGADTSAALSKYKADTGGSNTYGNTVGKETFDKLYGTGSSSGSTTKGSGAVASEQPPSAVGSGVTVLPGEIVIPADQYSDALYQQAVLNEQIKQQNQEMIAAMEAQYAEQQEALRRRTEATVNSINSNRTGVEDAYQKAQREAYINSVLQQNQMSDYLSAAGYSGGMAESTLAKINNNYANNRQQATSERDTANLELDRMIAEARASGDASLADAANNYYSNYLAALENQQQLEYQLNSDLMGQINAEQQARQQAAQLQYERDQYNKEYTDAQAKDTAAQDFNTFLNTYKGKYNKKSTYEQWIKNLQGMDDPYGYNSQKIAYLRQYINKTFGSGSSSGGSGGGGGTATGTGTGTKTGTAQVSTAAKNLVTELRSKFPAGITAEAKANAVENAISKGNYSNTDIEYILSAFGY